MTRYFVYIIGAILGISAVCSSDTLDVPSEYASIQAGIDAAGSGDTVLVAPGTYVENISFKGKAISVKSRDGASATTIDGEQSRSTVTFFHWESLDSVLEGFTVTNGIGTIREYAPGTIGYLGGGIYCESSSPTLRNNIIIENSATVGGGICCSHGSPSIIGNTISENTAEISGGGIYCKDQATLDIKNTMISGNKASDDGGGIHSDTSSLTLSGCTVCDHALPTKSKGAGIYCTLSFLVIENTAIMNNSAAYGGGFYCLQCDTTFSSSTIADNSATFGGGMYNYDSATQLTDTTVTGNSAFAKNSGYGGAFYNHYGNLTALNCCFKGNSCGIVAGACCSLVCPTKLMYCEFVENHSDHRAGAIHTFLCKHKAIGCTFTDNSAGQAGGALFNLNSQWTLNECMFIRNTVDSGPGGGICNDSYQSFSVTNCTFCKNSASWKGGAVAGDTHGSIINSIFWDNRPQQISGSSYFITYCAIQGGWPSSYIIDSDPLFVDAKNDDYHLTFDSPCRGTGWSSYPGNLSIDFEGDPRRTYGTVDIGADEFYTHLYCTGDSTPGGSIEIKLVGVPGALDVVLFCGSGILDPPVPTKYGNWYLDGLIMDPVVLPAIPPCGVLVLTSILPGSWSAPYDLPMQSLIGAELTNLYVLEVR